MQEINTTRKARSTRSVASSKEGDLGQGIEKGDESQAKVRYKKKKKKRRIGKARRKITGANKCC